MYDSRDPEGSAVRNGECDNLLLGAAVTFRKQEA